ncbi:MAG: hypothetical protein CMH60_02945 [Myxococcales bacterium]|nr:hypothetical protein [Myxococcales bacterium]
MQNEPEDIGIWQPTRKNGKWVFLRQNQLDPEGLWSGRLPELNPDKEAGCKRICFLGESAAAGYFYAPHMTPAKALERKLSSNSPIDEFEIIDLACVDIDATRLVDLALKSMQLNPDILLVFAGNNWPQSMAKRMPTSKDADLLAGDLRANTLANYYHKAGASLATAVIEDLKQIAKHFEVELIFVIPEINLKDWERHTPPPLLPASEEERWHSLKTDALNKLEERDFDGCLNNAKSMQRIDQSCATSSARLKGEALLAKGELESARDAFRQEVDARSWSPLLFTPGITQPIADRIRAEAKPSSFCLVDLPVFFKESFPRVIAGDQWFLDYCHFNIEGMELAAQAMAEKISSNSTSSATTSEPNTLEATSAKVQASAKFAAAIYQTHSGQAKRLAKRNSVRKLLQEAQSTWPELTALASDYLEGMALLKATDALSEPFQNLYAKAEGTIVSRLYTKNIANKIDPEVSELLRSALTLDETTYQTYLQTLIEQHSPKSHPLKINEHFFSWDLAQAWANARNSLIHHSYEEESSFTLLSKGTCPYHCKIVLRISPEHKESAGKAKITLNDSVLTEFHISPTWTEHSFPINAEQLHYGFNKLCIQWPFLSQSDSTWAEQLKANIEKDLPIVPFRLFGQIAELEISAIT